MSNSNKRLEERSMMRWWRKRGNIAPQRLSAMAVVLGLVCHYSASYPKSLAAVSPPSERSSRPPMCLPCVLHM